MDPICEVQQDILNLQALMTENPENMEPFGANERPSEVGFKVNMSSIATIPSEQQAEELRGLGVGVYDQIILEEEVMGQVDLALQKQEEEKRRKYAVHEIAVIQDEIRSAKQRMGQLDRALEMAPKEADKITKEAKRQINAIEKEKDNKNKQLKKLDAKLRSLNLSIGDELVDLSDELTPDSFELDEETKIQLEQAFSQKETEEERLIRMGEMTPFGTKHIKLTKPAIKVSPNELTDFEKFLLGKSDQNDAVKVRRKSPKKTPLKQTPETSEFETEPSTSKTFPPLMPKRIKRKKEHLGSQFATGIKNKGATQFPSLNTNYGSDAELSDVENGDHIEREYNEQGLRRESDEDYFPDGDVFVESDDDYETECKRGKFKVQSKDASESDDIPWTSVKSNGILEGTNAKKPKKSNTKRIVDDGNQLSYAKRLKQYRMQKLLEKQEAGLNVSESDNFTELDETFKVPTKIWEMLYRYQQTGVRWLWELHQQSCGGIIGDEMGLGKTIQVIAFFAALQCSQIKIDGDRFQGLGPTVLVCPATIMHQWVREFHKWWPPLRIAVLHETGSYTGSKEKLVASINSCNGVIITSYSGIASCQSLLLSHEWHYVILDEGHKIRNPDAQATLVCKQFRTPHRVILSGSPVQNNLKELWSLFDFIFPGKLGTLPVFLQEFAVPITHGGYANATQVQVQTAYKCAVVLRDTIKPYILRRMKSDVKMSLQLPNKSEQVLFCQLSEEQRNLYKGYLESPDIASIVEGRLQIFVGLTNLRKICNHPDIFTGGPKIFKDTDVSSLSEDMRYGYYKRSGKMIVVEALLRLWKKQGHRVLLFTQSRMMLAILKEFVESRDYTYVIMDGTTNIGSRQPLIARFNTDDSIFIFILTTRVGGLGINLTGANRVLIYDPDWNPSTDSQARERAWRIGQNKQVTIYRLLTAGTIEEKIYHRQIFKQFLVNRVLKDPRQRRFFKSNDLHELFTLGDAGTQGTETSAIFAGTGSEIKMKSKGARNRRVKVASSATADDKPKSLRDDKVQRMRELARKLSQRLTDARKTNDAESGQVKIKLGVTATEKFGKKRNKIAAAVEMDGQKIDHLVKLDTFKSDNADDDEQQQLKQDEYILKKLFKNSAVQTALKHDQIIESADPDYLLVEGEADRVAREAVRALKRSRQRCRNAESGVPTWTGSSGSSGAPPTARPRFGQKKNTKLVGPEVATKDSPQTSKIKVRPKFGDAQAPSTSEAPMSSSDLLLQMRQRKQLGVAPRCNVNNSEDESEPVQATEYDDLLCDIRNFIAFQSNVNGQATTQEVLDAFHDKVPKNGAPVFKALLEKICDFHRSTEGHGLWQLKTDFR